MNANEVLAILREIWPGASDGDIPTPVISEFVRRALRSGLGTDGFQAACIAHRLEDKYASKAPDYNALWKRITSKAENVKAVSQSRQGDVDDAREREAAQREAESRAGLRRLLDGLDDAELRDLLRRGGESAPHLAEMMRGEGEWPAGGDVAGARRAWAKPLTVEAVMGNQHLRCLARRGVVLTGESRRGG